MIGKKYVNKRTHERYIIDSIYGGIITMIDENGNEIKVSYEKFKEEFIEVL